MSNQNNSDALAQIIGKEIGLSLSVVSVIVKALKLQPNFDASKFDNDILELLSKQGDKDLRDLVSHVLNINLDN